MPYINYLYYCINIAGLGEPFAEELVSSLGDRFDPTLSFCVFVCSFIDLMCKVRGLWCRQFI